MSGFRWVAVAVTAALTLVSSSALAAVPVEGNSATFAWTPSSGPVVYYAVYLNRNDEGFTSAVAAYVSEPQVTVHGEYRETISVQVVAWGWIGSSVISSMPSPVSRTLQFVDPND